MRTSGSLLVLLCSIAVADAGPRKVAAIGATLVAPEAWTDTTTGEEISLVIGNDFAFRVSMVPTIAERLGKAVTNAKECAAFATEFAGIIGIEKPAGALAKAGGRSMCEVSGTLVGNQVVAQMFPLGKTAAVTLCLSTGATHDKKRIEECRGMAASLTLDPKAKPSAKSAYTTSKQPKGVTRVTAGNAQLDLPTGWIAKDGSAGQLFAASKNNTTITLRRVERRFEGDTEANCKKLASAKAQPGAKTDGRLLKLRPGTACLVSVETTTFANVVAFINVPKGAEHFLFGCMSMDREEAVMKECGDALGSLTFP
jgi:hypothetical protein